MNYYTPNQDADGLVRNDSVCDGMPNVLLIGDSISIGYTGVVRECLAGVCAVSRPDANCGDTRSGLAHIESWLGDTGWDVIHFNWGLHDLCYRSPQSTVYGNRDKVNGTLSVPVESYAENLQRLVEIMRPRARRLIWASTTVVPEGEAGRHQGDEVVYNQAAVSVMELYDIPVNDLYRLTSAFQANLFTAPGDVHYTKQSYGIIGEAVAECIRAHVSFC